MSYFYLSETAPFPYSVDVKPPPADNSTAIVHRGAPDGDQIYSADLEKQGKGTFNLDMSQLKVDDSPVFIEFKFEKDGNEKGATRAVVLAEALPAKVTVPKSAKVGDEVELKVSSWVAVKREKPGETSEVKETNGKRLGDVKPNVQWQVGGQDLADKGDSVKLTITEDHLGKALQVEAYIGTPTGRAVATLNVFKVDALTPDDSATDPEKWYVNQPASEDDHCGRTVTLQATLVPAVKGTTVHFILDQDVNRTIASPPDLQPQIAAKLSAKTAKTDETGVAKVKLTLATYGGDKYRVIAALDKDAKADDPGTKKTRWFEVWRKLSYEVDCMLRPDGSSYSDRADTATLESKLKDVFIELESTGADDAPALKRVVTFQGGEKWTKPLRQWTGGGQYFHLAYVYATSAQSKTDTVEFSAESTDWSETLAMRLWCIDPDDWFVSGSWKQGKKGGSIPKAACTIDPSDADMGYNLTWDFASFGVTPSDTDPVSIKMKIKSWVELGGFQTGPCTVIGCRWAEIRNRMAATAQEHLDDSDVKNALLTTALHEPGHSFGLASQFHPQAPRSKIPTTYSKNGWHCHENSDGCLMYETIPHEHPVPAPSYCDSCTDAVRARQLTRLPLSGGQGF